jgi:homoserine acetyltransferase
VKILVFLLCALIAAIVIAGSARAETSCDNINELRKEWMSLEERTSGGIFFSDVQEKKRLRELRRIMRIREREASECDNFHRTNKIIIKIQSSEPLKESLFHTLHSKDSPSVNLAP